MNYKGTLETVYTCIECSVLFQRTYYTRKTPKFCCKQCNIKHRSKQSEIKFDDGGVLYYETQRRILTERYGYECVICGLSEWLNTLLVLQVDHIDGDPANNKGSNLRLLCPNCHSQTDTYKGGSCKRALKQDKRSRGHRHIYKQAKKMVGALGIEPSPESL